MDGFIYEQWALYNDGYISENGPTVKEDADIDADKAWGITTGDTTVVIAIIDTGIDWEHPELRDNLWINSAEDGNGDLRFTANDTVDVSMGGDFGDKNGDGYPGVENVDDDGDGGTDFNDPDIKFTDYDKDGILLCGPDSTVGTGDDDDDDKAIAAADDDENGLVDDIIGWDFSDTTHFNGWNPRILNSNWSSGLHHGTRVASIAAARGNNESHTDTTMMAGIAWNAKIMILRIDLSPRYATADQSAMAIDYARQKGAHIINMSYGDANAFTAERVAVENAIAAGIFVAVSAGNENQNDSTQYPANYANVCGIMSTDYDDQKGNNSNYNATDSTWYDLGAPGTAITHALPRYAPFPHQQLGDMFFYQDTSASGDATSYSSALVSGTAVLLKAEHPSWSGMDILHQLRNTAENIEDDLDAAHKGRMGEGRLNAYAALGYFDDALGPIEHNRTWRHFLFLMDTVQVDSAHTVTLLDTLTITSDARSGLVMNYKDTLLVSENACVTFPDRFYLNAKDSSLVIVEENAKLVFGDSCHIELGEGCAFLVGKNASVAFGDTTTLNIASTSTFIADTGAVIALGSYSTFTTSTDNMVEFMPGDTIKCGTDVSFDIYGRIQCKGTAAKPITFTGVGFPPPGNDIWEGISIYENTTTDYPANRFDYVTFKYADAAIETRTDSTLVTNCRFESNATGVKGISSSPLVDDNIFISNAYAGMHLNRQSRTISGNRINSNSAYGIIADNVSCLWNGNHADSNNVGLQCYGGTSAIFRSVSGSDSLSGNTFRYNSTRGIISDNASPTFEGPSSTDAFNSCHDNNSPAADIDALNYSVVSGIGNYVLGGVTLYSDGTSSLSWGKQKMWDPIPNAPPPPALASPYDTLRAAITERLQGDYTASMSTLKNFVDRNHAGSYAPRALRLMFNVLNDAEFILKNDDPISKDIGGARNSFDAYLQSLTTGSPSQTLRLFTRELHANHKMRRGEFGAADSIFGLLANAYQYSEIEKRSLYGQAVARKIMQNQQGAKAKTDLLRSRYPDDRIGVVAKLFIGEPLTETERNMIMKSQPNVPTTRVEMEPVTEYALYQNYPNPFNPITKIAYSIPRAGHVSLELVDFYGRVVTKLVDESQEPGKYTVQVNGAHLSSGMYLYRLRANRVTIVRKMILLK